MSPTVEYRIPGTRFLMCSQNGTSDLLSPHHPIGKDDRDSRYEGPSLSFCLSSSPPEETSRRSIPALTSSAVSRVVCSTPLRHDVSGRACQAWIRDTPPLPLPIRILLRPKDVIHPICGADTVEQWAIPDSSYRSSHFQWQSNTVLEAPSVLVVSLIGQRIRELCSFGKHDTVTIIGQVTDHASNSLDATRVIELDRSERGAVTHHERHVSRCSQIRSSCI